MHLELLDPAEIAHLAAEYHRTLPELDFFQGVEASGAKSLPYDLLSGEEFERLCFNLLISKKLVPRFWGAKRVPQQGVDLVSTEGREMVVYQCKRHKKVGPATLANALDKFKKEWLSRPELGRPIRFVFWTSAPVKETAKWQSIRRRFEAETLIELEEWHRDTLNSWLRSEPGIVSDIFGERVAELFCGLHDNWDIGLFNRIVPGATRPKVDHYLALQSANSVVQDINRVTAFDEALARSQVILLAGRAGTGKTVAALYLSQQFGNGEYQIFYLNCDDGANADQMLTGIKGRSFRPSIFILDDAHKSFAQVERVVARSRALALDCKLVLTARTPPRGMDLYDPTGTTFVLELREAGHLMEIDVDTTIYSAILSRRMPQWSDPPLELLMALTGRDLAIFDLVLEASAPGDFESSPDLTTLYPKIRRLIFESERCVAPRLLQLSALAQFDIAVPEELFPEPFEAARNKVAVERLLVAGGEPSALSFRHPSSAELVFRLLCWAANDDEPEKTAGRECADIFINWAVKPGAATQFLESISRVLQTRLTLSDSSRVKVAFLSDPRVVNLLSQSALDLRLLSICTALAGSRVPQYGDALVDGLFNWIASSDSRLNAGTFRLCIRALRVAGSDAGSALEGLLAEEPLRGLILEGSSVLELLRLVNDIPAGTAEALLGSSVSGEIRPAIANSIEREESISTLGIKLRRQGKSIRTGGLGSEILLRHLGAVGLKLLIQSQGDFMSLLQIVASAPLNVGEDLVRSLSPNDMERLIFRSMGGRRRIGSLAVLLRSLSSRPLPHHGSLTQADFLLSCTGPKLFSRLVVARGDIVTLLNIFRYTSDTTTGELLAAFSSEDIRAMVLSTSFSREGLGTLGVTLRHLEKHVVSGYPGVSRKEVVLSLIGAPALAEILVKGADFVALMRVLANVSTPLAFEVLQQTNTSELATTVERTAKERNKIFPVIYAWSGLGKRFLPGNAGVELRSLLEQRISPETFWRLAGEAGTLSVLGYLLRSVSDAFRQQMCSAADSHYQGWNELVARGTFFDAAQFARDFLVVLNPKTREKVRDAIMNQVSALVAASTWGDIGSGLAALEDVQDVSVRDGLYGEALKRIEDIEVAGLAFEEFEEAAGAISVLSRLPAMQVDLGKSLWRLLPPEGKWPTSDKMHFHARFVLNFARSSFVSDTDAARAFAAFSKLAPELDVDVKQARYQALFLWNLFALWLERVRRPGDLFSSTLSEMGWKRLVEVVDTRLDWSDYGNHVDTLMLAGALAFHIPQSQPHLIRVLKGRVRNKLQIPAMAEALPCVPGFLCLQGLRPILPSHEVFTMKRSLLFLDKAQLYENRGPAIDYVCTILESYLVDR